MKSAESYCQSELSVNREDSGLERIRFELAALDEQERDIQCQLLAIDAQGQEELFMEGLADIQSSSPGLSDISNPALGCHEELVMCQERLNESAVDDLCDDVETLVQLEAVKSAHAETRPGKLEYFFLMWTPIVGSHLLVVSSIVFRALFISFS